MFCSNCGSQINDNSVICPVCNVQVTPKVTVDNSAPPYGPPPYVNSKKVPNAAGKSYAAIASALMVFPALICLAIDYLWMGQHDVSWSAYVFGGIMCIWMCSVLPALKPKRPALTACVCVSVMMLYLIMLAYINGNAGWYIEYCLPVCIMIMASSVILTLLIGYKVIKKEHIASAIFAQGGLLCVGFEILFDIRRRGTVNLGWSIIMLVIAISGVAIIEALSYTARVNRRNR